MATATPRPTRNLTESNRRVRHPLQRLRGYIRSYVSAEGIATLLIFVALWFWIGLLLDYESFNLFHMDWAQEVPPFIRTLILGGLFTLLALVGIGISLNATARKEGGSWLNAVFIGWLAVAVGALLGAVVRIVVAVWLGGATELLSLFLLAVAGLVLIAGLMVVVTAVLAGLVRVSLRSPWYLVVVVPVLGLYLFAWVGVGVLVALGAFGPWLSALLILGLLLGPVMVILGKRLLVDFRDNSLALVLERRYPKELGDRLITAVEMANTRDFTRYGYSTAMIEYTIHDAADRVQPLPVHQVFDWGRLVRLGLWVGALTLGIYLLAGAGFCVPDSIQSKQVSLSGYGRLNDVIGLWAERNLLLQNTLWPRQAYLEVVGYPESGELRIPQNTQPEAVVVRAYKWVVADKDHSEGWRPLRWDDLKTNPALLGAPMPPDSALAELLVGTSATVDDIEVRLGQGRTHETLPADAQKSLRDLLGQLEEQAARPDMRRKLRMLKLPEKVIASYQGKDTRGTVDPSREPGNLYIVKFPVLKESIDFRVRGEDYFTARRRITTVPPPQLIDLYRDEYQPGYLHYRLPRNEDPVLVLKGQKQVLRNRGVSLFGSETSRFDVPAGSDVVLIGKVDKPLQSVTIKERKGASIPFQAAAELLPDKEGFQVRFDKVQAGANRIPGRAPVLDFDLTFTDTDNVSSTRNVVIKPVDDGLPTANLETPPVRKSPKGHYLITPRAYIPFSGKMSDDHALDRINYVYTVAPEQKDDELGAKALLYGSSFFLMVGRPPEEAMIALLLMSQRGEKKGSDPTTDVRRVPITSFEAELLRRKADYLPVPEIRQRLRETPEQTAQRLQKTVPQMSLNDILERLRDQPPLREMLKFYDLKPDDGSTPFDLEGLPRLGDDRVKVSLTPGTQQRYQLQVWGEALDNDIETGPNRGRSKDTYNFLVVSEEELRLEIFKEEEDLRIRLQEVLNRLRGAGSAEYKLVNLLNDMSAPNLKPDGFGPMIARANELRQIVEKGQDETNKIHLDYLRILKELQINRCQQTKIDQVEDRIVKPMARLLRGEKIKLEGRPMDREVGFPVASKSLGRFGQGMASSVEESNKGGGDVVTMVAQARQDAQDARERVKDLADAIQLVLNDMEEITKFDDVIKKAMILLEGVTRQEMALGRWHKWLQDDILRKLLNEPEKKP